MKTFPIVIVLVLVCAAQARAQDVAAAQQADSAPLVQAPAPQPTTTSPPQALVVHKFWDRENALLFGGMFTSRMLDFSSTIHNRNRGLDEGLLTNGIVDNHPLFFTIEAGTAAASIGLSYLFHRTGHHRLERATSMVHIGVATTGAVRNYALKSPH